MKLRPLAVLAACLALTALWVRAQFAPAAVVETFEPRTPLADRRAPDNTFLTYPEWYLVYSPDEYADFLQDRPPSEFPYLGHVGQLWESYAAIHQATKDDYPFNADYHVMIVIIATSTSIEYGLKWGYETIVGRVTEWTWSPRATAEDRLAARTAREYVEFLDREPWFNFDFLTPLVRLWTETGTGSDQPLRSWERKYFLTSDYLAKAAYAWVIKQASESSYGVESQVTAVVLDRLPADVRKDMPEVKVLSEAEDGSVLAQAPRYQAFTKTAQALADRGINFIEIAGNRGPILMTLIIPGDDPAGAFERFGLGSGQGREIFGQPLLTRHSRARLGVTVQVSELSATLRRLDRRRLRVEHIYDY